MIFTNQTNLLNNENTRNSLFSASCTKSNRCIDYNIQCSHTTINRDEIQCIPITHHHRQYSILLWKQKTK